MGCSHCVLNICSLLDVCWSKVCSFSVSGLNLYLLFASMVFHYFYELTFIVFVGHLLPRSQLFCTITNMYIYDGVGRFHKTFNITYVSCVSPIEYCLWSCECLSRFRPKLWNTMGIAGNVLPHRIWRHHRSHISCENLYVSFISNLLESWKARKFGGSYWEYRLIV